MASPVIVVFNEAYRFCNGCTLVHLECQVCSICSITLRELEFLLAVVQCRSPTACLQNDIKILPHHIISSHTDTQTTQGCSQPVPFPQASNSYLFYLRVKCTPHVKCVKTLWTAHHDAMLNLWILFSFHILLTSQITFLNEKKNYFFYLNVKGVGGHVWGGLN